MTENEMEETLQVAAAYLDGLTKGMTPDDATWFWREMETIQLDRLRFYDKAVAA